MKLTNNDHSHWQCSEDDEADHAQHCSKRGGEERGIEGKEGGKKGDYFHAQIPSSGGCHV